MKLLLDIATLLWISHDAEKLSPSARSTYSDPDNQVHVSVVTLWEIIVKNRLGKLPLPTPLKQLIQPFKTAANCVILPLTESAVMRLRTLPDIHRDPFDRMLICQALDLDLTLVTPDTMLSAYPVSTLW